MLRNCRASNIERLRLMFAERTGRQLGGQFGAAARSASAADHSIVSAAIRENNLSRPENKVRKAS